MTVDLETMVLVEEEDMRNAADSIREVGGSTQSITPLEMPQAIRNLTVGGSPSDVKFIEGTLTEIDNEDVLGIPDRYAFFGFNALLESVKLDKCASLPNSLFYGFSGITSVSFKSVQIIPTELFRECASIKSADFASATEINTMAFRLSGIENINIPKVTVIKDDAVDGRGAFWQCNSLTEFHAPELTTIQNGRTSVSSYQEGSFNGCANLVLFDAPKLNFIGHGAFQNCSKLETVNSENIETVGIAAFNRCSRLKNIDISKLTIINDYAFGSCALEDVDFTNFTSIGIYGFSGNKFTELDAPNLITIYGSAFYNCQRLESINIPNCEYIGDQAFASTALSGVLNLPKVTEIASLDGTNGAFTDTGITKVVAPELLTLSGNANSANEGVFRQCLQLTEVDAPKLESLCQFAFSGCASLTKINAKIKNISAYAFSGCSLLSDIDTTTFVSVGNYAFDACLSLPGNKTFPNVASVGSYAFNNCGQFSNLEFPKLTTDSDSSFRNLGSLAHFSAPLLTRISANSFYGDSGLVSVSAPLASSVGNYAFYNCTNLSSINLNSATSIGYSAFRNCYALKSISLPLCLTINPSAFVNSGLEGAVSLPNVTRILTETNSYSIEERYGSFKGTKITSIDLPSCTALGVPTSDDTRYAQYGTFNDCQYLTSVNIPKVVRIGAFAFSGCTSLTSIDIPSSCAVIGANAFQNCPVLTTINIHRDQDSISGAPWGATDAQINWLGEE